MLRPGISLCMIVKNEERHLARCLSSARPVCDEIIVVDTGSSDRTLEIAQAHGAQIEFYPWCDDFAAARNYALRFAGCEWVLQLDADEHLYEDDYDHVRRATGSENAVAHNITIVNDLTGGGAGTFSFPRLFRNGRGFEYKGRIHEQLQLRGTVEDTPVRIHHVGYDLTAETRFQKYQQRLPLLEAQVVEAPRDPLPRYNLAISCHIAGQFDEGAKHARAAAEMATIDTLRIAALDLEGLCHQRLGRGQQALASFEEALNIDPDFIDALFDLGVLALEGGNAELAKDCYERYFEALPHWKKRPVPHDLMLRSLANETHAWNNLGCAYRRLGDLDAAIQAYEEVVRSNPKIGAAHYNLGITLATAGKLSEAVAPLEQAIALDGERPKVLRSLGLVYAQLGRKKDAVRVLQKRVELRPNDTQASGELAEAQALPA